MAKLIEIEKSLCWEYSTLSSKKKTSNKPVQLNHPDGLTLLAFGECGSGKSSFLHNVTQVFTKKYPEANGENPIHFESAKSAGAVTTKV